MLFTNNNIEAQLDLNMKYDVAPERSHQNFPESINNNEINDNLRRENDDLKLKIQENEVKLRAFEDENNILKQHLSIVDLDK